MKGKLAAAVGAVLVSLGLSTSAWAALLVDWKPDPPSPKNYELSWSGTQLFETPVGVNGGGAISDGDGVVAATLGPQHQLTNPSRGLLIGTPLDIRPVFGPSLTSLGGISNADGSSTFYDVTLHLDVLNAIPPAIVTPIITGITTISQPIGRGTFQLLSTPDANGKQTLLLSGLVSDMLIVGNQNDVTASVLSTTVEYTGGLIFQRLQQVNGGDVGGKLAWALTANTGLGLNGTNPQTWLLSKFDADAAGVFNANAIPEPATLSILGLGALGLIRRKRN